MKIDTLSGFSKEELYKKTDNWIKQHPTATVKNVDPTGNSIEGFVWLIYYLDDSY